MSARRVATGAAVLALAAWTASAARTLTKGSAAPNQAAIEDSLHPGPDSARVVRMLDALARTDTLVCEMIADQLGNFWNDEGRSGIGRFGDAPRTTYLAKDSLHGRVRNAGAIRILVAHLATPDPCVRRVAAKLLGHSTIAAERLTALLGEESSRVREAAAYAAGSGERKDVRATLERMLAERGATDAAMAAWALGEISDSASVPPLLRAVRAADGRVRAAAVHALGDMEDERAVPELERALRDAEATVREHAARGLGNLGAAGSANPLAAALDDTDADVRVAAAQAIGELHDLDRAPVELTRAVRSRDTRLRIAASHTLAEIHDPATIDVLIELLSDANREVRLHAVGALGEIKSPKSMPALVKALKDVDAEVRRAAAEALGEIEGR